MKGKKIVDGWKNLIVKDELIEALSSARLQICNGCTHKESMLGMDICGVCLCPLAAKTRSPESKCPLNLWQALIIKE